MIQRLGILIGCLFFHSKNGDVDPKRSYDEYYMPLVELKDFKALINNKSFFDQPIKNQQEVYEKLVEMSRNYDYKTGNLLDYSSHQKLIGIDLSRQLFFHKLMSQ